MPPWKYINTHRTNTSLQNMAFSASWLRSKPLSNSREQLGWSKQLIRLRNTCLDNLNWRSLPVRKQRYDQWSVNFTWNCYPGVTECAFHRCIQGNLVRVRGTRHLGNRCVPADFGASGTLLGALARTLLTSEIQLTVKCFLLHVYAI